MDTQLEVINNKSQLAPSVIFKGVELYPDLGERHNEELDLWFSVNKDLLRDIDVDARLNLVDTYFEEKYLVNVSDIKYRIFNVVEINPNIKLSEQILDFDPFIYLEMNKSKIQVETYEILFNFFTETEKINNLEDELKYLKQLEADVISSTSISSSDKNGIRNLIIVYKASVEYWTRNLNDWLIACNGSSTKQKASIKKEDYQKNRLGRCS